MNIPIGEFSCATFPSPGGPRDEDNAPDANELALKASVLALRKLMIYLSDVPLLHEMDEALSACESALHARVNEGFRRRTLEQAQRVLFCVPEGITGALGEMVQKAIELIDGALKR